MFINKKELKELRELKSTCEYFKQQIIRLDKEKADAVFHARDSITNGSMDFGSKNQIIQLILSHLGLRVKKENSATRISLIKIKKEKLNGK